MNIINKRPLHSIGYNFIAPEFLPKGKDEYYLRDIQNRSGIDYRQLTAFEIEVLVRNSNTSDDWNKILVSDAFNPEFVKNCKFFGLIRIGKLEPYFLEFHNLRMRLACTTVPLLVAILETMWSLITLIIYRITFWEMK
jgi:hypothetical protein